MSLETDYADGVVTAHLKDTVLTVTLNRPDKLNAIDLRVVSALVDIQRRITDRRDIHVVVFRGAGRVFSAGADLHHIDSVYKDPRQSRLYLNTLRDACMGFEHLRQPVIAAVHGMVLAGGLEAQGVAHGDAELWK